MPLNLVILGSLAMVGTSDSGRTSGQVTLLLLLNSRIFIPLPMNIMILLIKFGMVSNLKLPLGGALLRSCWIPRLSFLILLNV